MDANKEMLEALTKRQEELILQVREAQQEIELYEEDDTSAIEEDLDILQGELDSVNKQIMELEQTYEI